MKTLSTALAAHLTEECTTLAYLIKITRSDGVVTGFTNHDADLVVGGVTYRADSALNPSALLSSDRLSADNLGVNGILSDDAITEADLRAGRYDRARCDIYVCNWAAIDQGVLQLRRGWIGAVSWQAGRYEAELLGLHDRLQQEIGDYYLAECRHDLGDVSCGVALAAYRFTGTVTAAENAQHFIDTAQTAADGLLNYGQLVWTSGVNQGLAVEVKTWDAAARRLTLWLPMTTPPVIGDGYSVTAGCDKRLVTCRDRFGNLLNFGGFPHIPGVDRILNYPDSKA